VQPKFFFFQIGLSRFNPIFFERVKTVFKISKSKPTKIQVQPVQPIFLQTLDSAGFLTSCRGKSGWLDPEKSGKNRFFDNPYTLWLTASGARWLQG